MSKVFYDARAWGLLLVAVLALTANPGASLAMRGLLQLFGLGDAEKLLVAAPLMTGICAPLIGLVMDRTTARWPVLLAGLVLYALAGTIGPYLDGYNLTLASRIVLGIGGAMILTAQGAMIGDYFAEPDRGRLIGLQVALLILAESVLHWSAFALLGLDPRLPFALAALPLLLLPVLWRLLPTPPVATRGATPGRAGWLGMVALLVFAYALSSLLVTTLTTTLPLILPMLTGANETFGHSFIRAVILPLLILALASGWIRERLGLGRTMTLGLSLVTVGLMLMMLGLLPMLIGAALVGAGLGLCLPTCLTGVLDLTPVRFRGLMVGCAVAGASLGAVLGPVVTGYYLNIYGLSGLLRQGVTVSGIFAILVYFGLRSAPVDKLSHPD